MELVLLLQELQQEKTHQQLLSPLPFPTSLPLLAASVASSKTVIADPIRYLQSLTHDMLQTVSESVLFKFDNYYNYTLNLDCGVATTGYVTKSTLSPSRLSHCFVGLHLPIIV